MGSGFMVGAAVAAACLVGGPAAAQAPSLKPGEGQQAVQTVCTRCHTLGTVIARPHTADEWNEIISKMIDKGMMASDDQLDEIATYLAKTYAAPSAGPAPSKAASGGAPQRP